MFKKAIETARKNEEAYYCSEVLGEVGVELTKAGRLKEAERVFNEAIETARRIKYEKERAETLAKIAPQIVFAANIL